MQTEQFFSADFKRESIYQKEIISCFLESKSHILIEAVAGSGKTTTLLKILENIDRTWYRKILLCAFNKKIQQELTERAKHIVRSTNRQIDIKTIHSACYSLFARKPNLETNKYIDMLLDNDEKMRYNDAVVLSDIYNMSMLTLNDNYDHVIAEYFSDEKIPADYKNKLNFLKNSAPHKTRNITYTEMLYIPYVNKMKNEYDLILVDEAQDLCALQQSVIFENFSHEKTRFIIVGDSRQAIYGFAGADKKAFEKYRTINNIEEKTLPVCYRCPQSHVELAKKYNNLIECFQQNEQGIIEEIDSTSDSFVPQPNSLIICRNNAPLIKLYFRLIKRGVKCVILSDIYKSLFALLYQVQELQGFDFNHLPKYLEELYKIRSENMRKTETKQLLLDKIETLIYLYQNMKPENIKAFFKEIKKFFKDEPTEQDKIILLTIHKAKGLEAENVYFYMPELVKVNFEEQENNLYYIALTRSKKSLFFLK